MPKDSSQSTGIREKTEVGKIVVAGVVIGGIAGVVAGLFDEMGLFAIPKLSAAYSPIVTGAALGIIVGGGIGAVIGYASLNEVDNNLIDNKAADPVQNLRDQDVSIKIREEQLDIAKKLVQTGEVTVHKEVLREDKNLVIPVIREELVIEKKVMDNLTPDKADKPVETIRIPISEEQIEVKKQPVVLNNVSIFKHKIHETKRVEGNLKKEKVHVEVIGKAKVNKD